VKFHIFPKKKNCPKLNDHLKKKKVAKIQKIFKKNCQISIPGSSSGSQKYVRMLFFFHILVIAKIWRNWLIDDPHLSYIRKLGKKTLKWIPGG
jgi:hypothetical protein